MTTAQYTVVGLLVLGSISLQFAVFHERLPNLPGTTIKSPNPLPGSVYNLIRDAVFVGPQYRADWEYLSRYVEQLPDRAEQHLLVPPFCPMPKSIFQEPLLPDPTRYPNGAFAAHLGIASIRVDPGLYCYNNTTLVAR